MRSNCLIWGLWAYAVQLRAWVRAGMPKGREPYLLVRPSRLRPRWLPHVLVGQMDGEGRMRMRSYVPVSGADLPWFLAWLGLLFKGHEVEGDWQDTVAMER